MSDWSTIWERACARHGEDSLRALFPDISDAEELRALGDDRYLSAMSKRVFAAGFRWRVVQAKWDGFEEAFEGFDPDWVADLTFDGIEALAHDTRIVRNRLKIGNTVNNAEFVRTISREHGGFGQWLANWPLDQTLDLWAALKNGGDRLGGDTSAWFLRLVGRDTFRLTSDVCSALIEAGVVPKKPTGKKHQQMVQEAMLSWADESGLSLGAVSVVLACSTGEIYRH
jgi:3-methyladenine DNA glycosylase Tag